ncbi:MAG: bifunctional tRNA (5-methylaminomethyl-2-thiouridine)(34)-methyltransferase MnmD/FAD-dependent 5-carboxymethylaminomethyl-2-thiouridine(34) oxidoreductase MnmC [Pseudomonadota bacterium]|nr:bifunctional tRNA (5-methylaminomethyl-2-thiouridine)(34)-methyltransferase MnmD/FAD-dependent 5-carboxymethylaminomethyl-2-thiouridine(34) oxidoreductase MnmC [Pseudomonadota bacterium]
MSSNKLTLAQVSWTNEAVPKSEQFGDFYFSTDGGMAEVEHTFIQPNNLPQRFAALKDKEGFRIAETGFGSGLNFLMTCDLWLKAVNETAQLHFISFEKYPLHNDDLAKAHLALPGLVTLAKALQENYPVLLPGWHDVWLFDNRVRLTLWFGDVLKGLPECDASECSKVDTWFLDGFAPIKNPDMWQPGLYQQMARLSHLQTTFSTFTAAGDVRRALEKIGFTVNKASGFGKKREICSGQLSQQRPYSLKTPWFSRPQPVNKQPGTAIVIGAGLAGGAVANQLAKSGWQVQVLEAEKEIATQASGNLAGTVHPLITADWNLRSQWYLQGFEATLRTVLPWLQEQQADNAALMGNLSGLVQLAVTQTSAKRVTEAIVRVGLPENFARLITQAQASEIIGTQAGASGVLFPSGGWLYPKAVIERCLADEKITLFTEQKVEDITQFNAEGQSTWQVNTHQQVFNADIVVVATGSLDQHLNEQLNLPIRPVKGQVTHLTAEQQTLALKIAVTHEGYSTGCGQGLAVTGATFEAPDMSQELSLESHQANLDITQTALPDWLDVTAEKVSGRIAFRPTTPDHLPVIGAIADASWMQSAYLSQSHTHAVYRYEKQKYQTGLYVSNGHGPRGLMSVFLAAETLMADISGTALPQSLSLYHASHPARFAIRRWRSGEKLK